jgi:hypothetical protein
MSRDSLLPPYTPEEKLRELCMRTRFLYERIRQKRKKSQELVQQSATRMEQHSIAPVPPQQP